MKQLTTVTFVRDAKHAYEINEKVEVYLNAQESVGFATVTSIKPTAIRYENGEVVPHNEITFEFSDELKNQETEYSPYYSGLNKRLSLCDVNKLKESKIKVEQERLRRILKQDIQYKYVCLRCETIITSSKELKNKKCKHCRKEQLKKV